MNKSRNPLLASWLAPAWGREPLIGRPRVQAGVAYPSSQSEQGKVSLSTSLPHPPISTSDERQECYVEPHLSCIWSSQPILSHTSLSDKLPHSTLFIVSTGPIYLEGYALFLGGWDSIDLYGRDKLTQSFISFTHVAFCQPFFRFKKQRK